MTLWPLGGDIPKQLRGLLFIAALLIHGLTAGQQFHFDNFQSRDGLPSNEVHWVHIDSAGFYWFCTDKGIARFDEYDFETFTVEDGLAANSSLKMLPDSRQRLWVSHFGGGFSIINPNGEIELYPHKDALEKVLTKGFTQDFVAQDDGTLWVLQKYANPQLTSISPEGEISAFNSVKDLEHGESELAVTTVAGRGVGWFRRISLAQEPAGGPLRFDQIGDTLLLTIPKLRNKFRAFEVHKGSGSAYFVGINETLYSVSEQGADTIAQFDKGVLIMSLLEDTIDQVLWVCTQEGGYRIDLSGRGRPTRHFLEEDVLTSVKRDGLGRIWFTTHNRGVFRLNNPNLSLYIVQDDMESGPIYCMELLDDDLVIGDRFGNVLEWDGASFVPYFSMAISSPLTQIVRDYEGRLWFSGTIIQQGHGVKTARETFSAMQGAYFYVLLPDSSLAIGRYGMGHILEDSLVWASYRLPGEPVVPNRPEGSFSERVFGMTLDNEGRCLAACISGIKEFDWRGIGEVSHYGGLRERANSVAAARRGAWVAYDSYGLHWVNPDKPEELNPVEGVYSQIGSCLLVESDSVIWYGHSIGLDRILVEWKDGRPEVQSIRHYGKGFGLPREFVVDLRLYEGRMWIAYRNKVANFDPEQRPFFQKPGVFLTGFEVLGESRDPQKSYELSHREDVLGFEYTGISGGGAARLEYEYRLVGVDPGWSRTTSRTVRYGDLRPGNYRFEVRALNTGNPMVSDLAVMDIRIGKAWWMTWTFRLTGIILIGLAVLSLVIARRRAMARELEQERAITEYQQLALTAQMNPHFIFNSLNSIQNFILRKEPMEAYQYLTKYSKLMRQTMENMRSPFISLEAEIETLQAYLQMENLRLDEGFDFDIELEGHTDPGDLQVPGMLLQPYLENAVWHGIRHKKEGRGRISVRFRLLDSNLECVIEDNGIGREAASLLRDARKGHRSRGTQITRQRLKLMHDTKGTEFVYAVSDIIDESGQISGTRVLLTIPSRYSSSITETRTA